MTSQLARDLQSVTLYQRLGGAAGIRRIEEIKRHTCDFFAAGSGGPDDYRGRSMADAHRGMEIEATEYDAACDDILGTMRALHYDAPTRGEVGEILQSLKPEITHV